MPIKLEPSEVSVLVRRVKDFFEHYYDYEHFFEDNGIILYHDPRLGGKPYGLEFEFSKYEDRLLRKMLQALSDYVAAFDRKPAFQSKQASALQLIQSLVEKHFNENQNEIFQFPEDSPDTVQLACEEANKLISDGLYPAAIDRVHTFFHGYVRGKCKKWISGDKTDIRIKDAMLLILDNHSYFTDLMREEELKNIFRSLSNMCDKFDTYRNHHSLAHPSEALLGENEAKLMVNVVKSLYDYLESLPPSR